MLRCAIFADIHGKFLLPFKLVYHYQKITGETIDFILQCGDMGIFPNKNTLDKATLRHAKNSRDELGFMDDFIVKNPKIAKFLDELNIPMIGVRGNHECHDFLDALENNHANLPYFSVDVYQKVFICRTGSPFVLTNHQDSLNILGIGRIGDNKERDDKRFIQDYEKKHLKYLIKNPIDIDVLISHDDYLDSIRGYGIKEINEILNNIPIAYHFYGHTGEDFYQKIHDNQITKSIKIKELEFNRYGKLQEGCMIILEKENQAIRIKTVPLYQIIHFDKQHWKIF